VRQILCALLASLITVTGQAPVVDDAEVLRAVIEHTIRPEVRRFSGRAKLSGDPLLLILDRTSTICEPEHDRRRPVCVSEEQLERPEVGYGELVGALVLRNRKSEPTPTPGSAGVLLVPFSDLQQTLTQHSRDTIGYSAFSLPGYAADGKHALVFGFYTCGGRCQRGNLFALSRTDNGWRVDTVVALWIS
jgi:hypothetical protein